MVGMHSEKESLTGFALSSAGFKEVFQFDPASSGTPAGIVLIKVMRTDVTESGAYR